VGAEAWLDPETHALQMPNAGDFRYYDDWPLWGGVRGALATEGEMRDHVESVFRAQDELGVPHLAPTILLYAAQSPSSQQALELARVAVDIDSDCVLAVAGDSAFWSSGMTLDAHVGGLAQLSPAGWWMTVSRATTMLPVLAMAEEVHGLCRTVRALSDDGPLHVSHGDLAALPAVASGAESIGTGWDPRQRVSAYASYEARTGAGDGGQWFQQATLEGLLSLLSRAEANVLAQQDAALSQRVIPGAVPVGSREAFLHHAHVLSNVVDQLAGLSHRGAYEALIDRYTDAEADWDLVADAIGTGTRADTWIKPFQNGLERYGATEGY
jgi:hypothetical protein